MEWLSTQVRQGVSNLNIWGGVRVPSRPLKGGPFPAGAGGFGAGWGWVAPMEFHIRSRHHPLDHPDLPKKQKVNMTLRLPLRRK